MIDDRHADLLDALTLLRAQGDQIPVHDGVRLFHWFDGLAELIIQLPGGTDQRLAWVLLVANDLCRRTPGMPIWMAAAPLLGKLRELETSRV